MSLNSIAKILSKTIDGIWYGQHSRKGNLRTAPLNFMRCQARLPSLRVRNWSSGILGWAYIHKHRSKTTRLEEPVESSKSSRRSLFQMPRSTAWRARFVEASNSTFVWNVLSDCPRWPDSAGRRYRNKAAEGGEARSQCVRCVLSRGLLGPLV